MNCLLCQRKLSLTLKFTELFLLKSPENSICEKCLATFQTISEKHCPRCWKDGSSQVCEDCQEWEEQGIIINHRAIFHYNAPMKGYFSNYKFIGDYRLRAIFANYFKPTKKDKNFTLVPIPISDKRLQERGFNQVTGFLDAAKIPYGNLLLKSDSVKQSSLSREERLDSKNAFTVAEDILIPKKVLLIDDIYTTGTTLQHTVFTLKEAGVTEVKSFSLCR
ncbi:MAG: ComF family protein [Streptococcaceae bacterium]|jgi:ComF family protein|nr:ComF family protein [Streptococcaceae bacterium]